MTLETDRFVIPLSAEHIRTALDTAREDQDRFWRSEMSWLEEHNTVFWVQTNQVFSAIVKTESSLAEGEAARAGRLLANRTVRICLADDETECRRAHQNYQANLQRDDLRLRQPGSKLPATWDFKDILLEVFEDEAIVDALMDIRSERSRRSAAVILGLFCLRTTPNL